jgi:hypothetical protein
MMVGRGRWPSAKTPRAGSGVGRDIALRCPDAAARRPYRLLRQRQTDFETFGELAEKNRIFFRQNTGQPVPHAGQDVTASIHGFVFALPEGMFGKHRLGAVGEFVSKRFRDGRAKIVARLIHDAPRQIQRAITGLPFKFPDWLVNFSFHVPILFQTVRQRLSKPIFPIRHKIFSTFDRKPYSTITLYPARGPRLARGAEDLPQFSEHRCRHIAPAAPRRQVFHLENFSRVQMDVHK